MKDLIVKKLEAVSKASSELAIAKAKRANLLTASTDDYMAAMRDVSDAEDVLSAALQALKEAQREESQQEAQKISGSQYPVSFMGGQSRTGTHAVDYMMAIVEGAEYYAEVLAGDEGINYDILKEKMRDILPDGGVAAIWWWD